MQRIHYMVMDGVAAIKEVHDSVLAFSSTAPPE